MRIGIFIGSLGAADGLEGHVQQVVDAEKDGFDSLWSAQVLGVDALTLFALAGQRTQRIEMPYRVKGETTLTRRSVVAELIGGPGMAEFVESYSDHH